MVASALSWQNAKPYLTPDVSSSTTPERGVQALLITLLSFTSVTHLRPSVHRSRLCSFVRCLSLPLCLCISVPSTTTSHTALFTLTEPFRYFHTCHYIYRPEIPYHYFNMLAKSILAVTFL